MRFFDFHAFFYHFLPQNLLQNKKLKVERKLQIEFQFFLALVYFNIIKQKKYASNNEIEDIQIKVKDLVKECVDFAESSPFPSPEALYQDVYEGPYNFITD